MNKRDDKIQQKQAELLNQKTSMVSGEELAKLNQLKQNWVKTPFAFLNSELEASFLRKMGKTEANKKERSSLASVNSNKQTVSVVKTLSHNELTFPLATEKPITSANFDPVVKRSVDIEPKCHQISPVYNRKDTTTRNYSADSLDELCDIFNELVDDISSVSSKIEKNLNNDVKISEDHSNEILRSELVQTETETPRLTLSTSVENDIFNRMIKTQQYSQYSVNNEDTYDSSVNSIEIANQYGQEGKGSDFWEGYNFRIYLQRFDSATLYSKKVVELLAERDQFLSKYITHVKEWNNKWKRFTNLVKDDDLEINGVTEKVISTTQLLLESECIRAEKAEHDISVIRTMFSIPLINLNERILIKENQKVKLEQFIQYYDKLFLHEIKEWSAKIFHLKKVINRYNSAQTKYDDFLKKSASSMSKSRLTRERELQEKCDCFLLEWNQIYTVLKMTKNKFVSRIRELCSRLEIHETERLNIYKALTVYLGSLLKQTSNEINFKLRIESHLDNLAPETEVERWSEKYGAKTPFPDDCFQKMYAPEKSATNYRPSPSSSISRTPFSFNKIRKTR